MLLARSHVPMKVRMRTRPWLPKGRSLQAGAYNRQFLPQATAFMAAGIRNRQSNNVWMISRAAPQLG